MTTSSSPFESGLKMMEAQSQLAARSLINLIEMISASSHRYAEETGHFTREALTLMNEAASVRDATALADLQKRWAETCLKYGQERTAATMQFVEQCGQQALSVAARHAHPAAGLDPDSKT